MDLISSWRNVQVKNDAHEMRSNQGQHRWTSCPLSGLSPSPSNKRSWITLYQRRPVPRTPASVVISPVKRSLRLPHNPLLSKVSPKILILRPPPQHHSPWHKYGHSFYWNMVQKQKLHEICLLVVASDPKWQKKEITGREKGATATHPWCVELQWCSLCGRKPLPWYCRGAVVLQNPMSGVFHVFANMSWWGFRRGRETVAHKRKER